ncbi:DVUA0089 family protein [Paracoccus caeni]|uniref:DVUA0089 family protein n=1 Tax=Paracoccus caeni TaxID=657651 RepID=A0A934SH30_9RHOB|nr:DVUA0089 family protein [Paracoccus caeni]MBK4217330.1 DVUA0089 family protein [Paracoccus caeni]
MNYRNSLLGSVAICGMVLTGPAFAQDAAAPAEEPGVQTLDPLGGEATEAQSGVTPSCGNVGQVVWLGGDESTSEIGSANAPLQQNVQIAGGQVTAFAFSNAGASQQVRIEVQADGNDPMVTLTTAEGEYIGENDDAPESLNSRLESNVGPGVYCAQVESIRGENMTATVQVGRQDQPALLSDSYYDDSSTSSGNMIACTAETDAAPLVEGALDQSLPNGAATASADGMATGYYRFTLGEPTALTLRASSNGDLDPYLALYDANGVSIAENDDADGLNSRLDFVEELAAGDYCIGVMPLSYGQGQIQLSAEALDRDSFLRQAYDRGEMVPPADSNHPVQEFDLAGTRHTVLLNSGKAQWLRFQVTEPSVVVVYAYGSLSGADPKLAMFSQAGSVIGQNDDWNDGTDSKLGPLELAPGTYLVAVSDVNSQGGTGSAVRPLGVMFDLYNKVQ